jgi:long-chain acyl-CoA synthetase
MTIRARFDAAVQTTPGATAMRFRSGGVWAARSYAETNVRVRQAAEAVGSLGVVPGLDPVALILENRPEWIEIYCALAGSGVTVVPVDPKLRAAEIAFILGDSGAVLVFAGHRQHACLEGILPSLPRLRQVVLVEGRPDCARCGDKPCLDFETFLASAAPSAAGLDAWFDRHRPDPESVASIVYTSGTTGKPKGAMLTHANFCADVDGALAVIADVGPRDQFLVVLPLFHSFSFTVNFVLCLSRGCCMGFSESLRTVSEDIRVLRPTVVVAVPLLVEKIYNRIDMRVRSSPFARLLLAVGLGRIVGAQARRTMGGRLRMMVVGGAPSPIHVLKGLRRLGIPVIEGYGLTEASPVVSLSRTDDARPGSIGYKLPNIEVRIADPDPRGVGELQVRGPIVMKGYFRNEAATREAFDGDWLRTGDLASLSPDGYLTIRGRLKAMIVNREGKNIYPEEIEQCIARHPDVLDVVVVGFHDRSETGERVGAIVVPDLDAIRREAGGVEPPWEETVARMRQAVQDRCRELADYKHPRKVDVRREPLERTSTQKVRRCAYQGQLD